MRHVVQSAPFKHASSTNVADIFDPATFDLDLLT